MPVINLKQHYPHLSDEILLDVSDPIFEVYTLFRREENNYDRRRRYHRAYYSLDKGDGIENTACAKVATPEELWLVKIEKEQLHQALEHLTTVQSRRIYAHFILGLKKKDIAKIENVTRSCVGESIQSGLKNLKKYYDKHFPPREE